MAINMKIENRAGNIVEVSQQLYQKMLKKGEVIRTIEDKPKPKLKPESKNEFVCPICGKVCKSKLGLAAHMRTHKDSKR